MKGRIKGLGRRLMGGGGTWRDALAVAATAGLVAIAAYGVGMWQGIERRPQAGDPVAGDASTHIVRKPAGGPTVAASPNVNQAPASPAKRVVAIDSHNDDIYPLADWHVEGPPSGYLDVTTIAGSPPMALSARPLKDEDILDLRGWAGDGQFGQRLGPLLVAVCDAVVASVPVEGARPDVAKAVHRNLGNSGWHARLLVADLPRCPKPVLTLWAAVPGTRDLKTLLGTIDLVLPEHGTLPEDIALERSPLAHPPASPVAPQPILVSASLANLRKCGDRTCDTVGRLSKGTYNGAVLDRAGGWSLISAGKEKGWIADQLFHVAAAGH